MTIMRSISFVRAVRSDHGGNAAVEFALLIPITLLLIFGVYQFGRIYWIENTLQFAAEQGGRYLMATPSASASQVTSVVCAAAAPTASSCGQGATFTINVQPTTQTNGTCFPNASVTTSTCVQISATYTFPIGDSLNTIVPTLVRLVTRTSASWTFTLKGLSSVAVS